MRLISNRARNAALGNIPALAKPPTYDAQALASPPRSAKYPVSFLLLSTLAFGGCAEEAPPEPPPTAGASAEQIESGSSGVVEAEVEPADGWPIVQASTAVGFPVTVSLEMPREPLSAFSVLPSEPQAAAAMPVIGTPEASAVDAVAPTAAMPTEEVARAEPLAPAAIQQPAAQLATPASVATVETTVAIEPIAESAKDPIETDELDSVPEAVVTAMPEVAIDPAAAIAPEPTPEPIPESVEIVASESTSQPKTTSIVPETAESTEPDAGVALSEQTGHVAPGPVYDAGAEQAATDEAELTLEIDDASSLFVDPVEGSDSASGSREDPFRTIRSAVASLEPDMTLYLRGGVYNEREIAIDVSGAPGAPITIRSYPGEVAVVDASDPELRYSNAGNWELVDASTGLYRSSRTDFGSDIYTGKVRSGERTPVTLVPYYDDAGSLARGLADLRSTQQFVDTGARYVGPGIYNSAGQLYVRLQPVSTEALYGHAGNPVGSTDAEAVSFELSDAKSVFSVSGSYISFHGLVVRGARSGFDVDKGARALRFTWSTYQVTGSSILLRENVQDVTVSRGRFEGNFPDHVAWTDMKGGDGQSMPASHWSMKSSGINASSVSDLEVSESIFDDVFDGLVVKDSHRIDVHDNSGFFSDDMIQIGSDSSYVHVRQNFIEGAGPSHYGKGDSPAPGTIYISGNIVDSRTEILWGKHDPSGILRSTYSAWRPQRPFQTHSASQLVSGDPWKIYHNTVVFESRDDGAGAGFSLWDDLNRSGAGHEVLNNIFVNHGDGPFAREVSVRVPDQVYDGNLYWRTNGEPAAPFDGVETSVGKLRFSSLEEFLSSDAFDESTSSHVYGWEANGVSADPQLQGYYRPSAAGPGASGAVAIDDRLPGTARRYRGAVAP